VRASADRTGGNPNSKGNDTYRDGERERVIHDGLQICACRIDARPSASFGINPGLLLDLIIQPSKANAGLVIRVLLIRQH
jgi:hypothetical protein